mmetsp:Transcript_70930/g.194498  ORF Transcript_70930/g.194498 Transcript_70930/m.194498 type:complete len:283 (-) Transcript_70930:28-876(-)
MIALTAAKGNGLNVNINEVLHFVAAEPHATFVRVSVIEGKQELAYESAVLGRLRGGYRIFQLRSCFGTRIELCYLFAKISFGTEINKWATTRQLRVSSFQHRTENERLKRELHELRRGKEEASDVKRASSAAPADSDQVQDLDLSEHIRRDTSQSTIKLNRKASAFGVLLTELNQRDMCLHRAASRCEPAEGTSSAGVCSTSLHESEYSRRTSVASSAGGEPVRRVRCAGSGLMRRASGSSSACDESVQRTGVGESPSVRSSRTSARSTGFVSLASRMLLGV